MTGLILVCADLSYHHQYGFQDPATTFFEMLIDFHHDMMFLLILVFLFVFYLLMATIYYFNDKSSSRPPVNLRYNTKIETIWTVVPALLLGWILMPAFSLIYAMDGPAGLPSIGFKAVGNQ
jgi:heme/copper-type cytochrome/quinol oxidase subunit 2